MQVETNPGLLNNSLRNFHTRGKRDTRFSQHKNMKLWNQNSSRHNFISYFLKSILIFSYLFVGLPRYPFSWWFRSQFFIHFKFLPCVSYTLSITFLWAPFSSVLCYFVRFRCQYLSPQFVLTEWLIIRSFNNFFKCRGYKLRLRWEGDREKWVGSLKGGDHGLFQGTLLTFTYRVSGKLR